MATQEGKDLAARLDELEARVVALENPAPVPAPPPPPEIHRPRRRGEEEAP